MRLTSAIFGNSQQQRRVNAHRALLRHLAKLGGSVFGQIPNGARREFFCLDERTWVWHEEWIDQAGQHQAMTTRYDIRPNGVLKSQGAHSYQRLSQQEEQNFRAAVDTYAQLTQNELQHLKQLTP